MVHQEATNSKLEYLKFAGVLLFILLDALYIRSISKLSFPDAFMGVFFVVFATFKIINLKIFANGFQGYDLLAKKSIQYAYLFPFIQLTLGVLYLIGAGSPPLDIFVVVISLFSGAGVIASLRSKHNKKLQVHCVCLGNVIKLPLSRISFVEDFGMALMAIAMLLTR